MNASFLLGFVLFFLSFLQISAGGAGSFIALDFASVLYFLIYPKRLLRNSSLLKWLSFALGALIGTRFFIGAGEFAFLARFALIFIDAFFLKELFYSRSNASQEIICSRALWLAAIAYAFAFLLWASMPDGVEPIFYLNNSKSWIATFPALFAVSHLIASRSKHAIFWALLAVALSFMDSSTSRALLLQSTLLIATALWQMNRTLAKVAIFTSCLGIFLFMNSLGAFIEKHDHSNTFRLVMIMQISDFTLSEIIFGRGIDLWRLAAFDALFDMPGAEEFFDSANPHFFPAELVIRGGILLFICAFGVFYAATRRSKLVAVPMVMLLATFLTTNTGVERLYMTLAIFILISVVSSNKVPRVNERLVVKECSSNISSTQMPGRSA